MFKSTDGGRHWSALTNGLFQFAHADRNFTSHYKGFAVSAATGEGIPELLAWLDDKLASRVAEVELLLPYDKLALAASLRQGGSVLAEEYREKGVYFKALADRRSLHLFAPYLL